MYFAAVEKAARFAWPAIEEQITSYGVLRFAHGYTRRANSLTLFSSSKVDHDELVVDCERFFDSRSQPAMIRVPCLPAMSRLDSFLSINGYAVESPSMVMAHSLSDCRRVPQKLRPLDKESWLDRFYAISGQPETQRDSHRKLIERIGGETCFVVLDADDGTPACCALAILYQGAVGIYNVATAPWCRRQQYASRMIRGLLGWGKSMGAISAYLQVEEANLPAVCLYRKLGFSMLYRYRYRVKGLLDQGGSGGVK
jgi:ribosomal protein S18 acetylase RimI-like enzyme